MAQIIVTNERPIAAPADRVYTCLADYNEHHPHILPSAFSNVTVEEGGVGAGTVISYTLTTGGRTRNYKMRVSEPEPGRVLVESDEKSSLTTTFTVTPQDAATSTTRIETRWDGAGGFGGFMERLFAPRVLQRLYAEELELLDHYARRHVASPTDEKTAPSEDEPDESRHMDAAIAAGEATESE